MAESTSRFLIKGEATSAAVAAALVRLSTPFKVEPRPDDEWAFVIKDHPHIHKAISDAHLHSGSPK